MEGLPITVFDRVLLDGLHAARCLRVCWAWNRSVKRIERVMRLIQMHACDPVVSSWFLNSDAAAYPERVLHTILFQRHGFNTFTYTYGEFPSWLKSAVNLLAHHPGFRWRLNRKKLELSCTFLVDAAGGDVEARLRILAEDVFPGGTVLWRRYPHTWTVCFVGLPSRSRKRARVQMTAKAEEVLFRLTHR